MRTWMSQTDRTKNNKHQIIFMTLEWDQTTDLMFSVSSQIYYHGEPISVNVHITNNTNKTVKKMKISGTASCVCVLVFPTTALTLVCVSAVRQYADICLFNTAQYKCPVAVEESE